MPSFEGLAFATFPSSVMLEITIGAERQRDFLGWPLVVDRRSGLHGGRSIACRSSVVRSVNVPCPRSLSQKVLMDGMPRVNVRDTLKSSMRQPIARRLRLPSGSPLYLNAREIILNIQVWRLFDFLQLSLVELARVLYRGSAIAYSSCRVCGAVVRMRRSTDQP